MDRRAKRRVGIVLAFAVGIVTLYVMSGELRGWLVHTIHGR
jgi:hypothetical protein